jgi:hypothetical protein
MMILCIWSYHGLWFLYNKFKLNEVTLNPRRWSGIALGAITVLVGLVVLMTLAIMCPPTSSDEPRGGRLRRHFSRLIRYIMGFLNNLRIGASQEPFLALLLFFTVFLGVSYLFGFTFAFHDISIPKPGHALYMKTLYMPDNKSQEAESAATPTKFQFDSLQAIPDIEKNPPQLQRERSEIKRVAERKNNNYNSLEAVVTNIKTTKPDDALRVIITGHADDSPPSGSPYISNYELSEARAENVKHRIIKRLASEDGNRWRNIEWLCLASSNEMASRGLHETVDDPQERKASHRKPSASQLTQEDKRFVEVSIDRPWDQSTAVEMNHLRFERSKDLTLLDYIYFANYTITTTGYGDIVPLTPYSKFICSLANICEVFFLVVFFNSLLSLKGRDKLSH